MTRRVPVALSIAGSDSGGGAGVQADLNTFGAVGVFATTAITAVTVQNTRGVSGFQALDPSTVAAQVRAVVDDIGVDAAKTGMLASPEIVVAVADAIAAGGIPALVVDPVSVSKHGHALLAGLPTGEGGLHAYFVHSYHMLAKTDSDIIATTQYGGAVTALVGRDNLVGT